MLGCKRLNSHLSTAPSNRCCVTTYNSLQLIFNIVEHYDRTSQTL